jgi:Na+/H+-dicarboxylate symporter
MAQVLTISPVMFVFRFAVLSLITSAIGKQNDLSSSFGNVGYLVAATLVAMAVHVVLVYCLSFWFVTKSNPIEYLRYMVP